MKKIVTFGDLHGHKNQLDELISKILKRDDINPDRDVFVFLGDYVDGGPDTKQVLDTLMTWEEKHPHWRFLFGNHESLLLDAHTEDKPIYNSYHLWFAQGGEITLQSFESEQVPDKYLKFLRSLPLYYESDDYFFVHGGVIPGKTLAQHRVDDFCPSKIRRGDIAFQMLWMRDPFLGSDYDWGKKIIFGHTAFPYSAYMGQDPGTNKRLFKIGYPFINDNKIGLDTMKLNTGRLTALILPDEEFVFTAFS